MFRPSVPAHFFDSSRVNGPDTAGQLLSAQAANAAHEDAEEQEEDMQQQQQQQEEQHLDEEEGGDFDQQPLQWPLTVPYPPSMLFLVAAADRNSSNKCDLAAPSAQQWQNPLTALLATGTGADLFIRAGGPILRAHRAILAAQSPRLRNLFFGPPQTRLPLGAPLAMQSFREAVEVIRFSYTGTIAISLEHILPLCAASAPLALDIPHLNALVKSFAFNSLKESTANIAPLWTNARLYAPAVSSDIVEMCLNSIDARTADFLAEPSALALPKHLVMEFLQRSKLGAAEVDVFLFVVRWGRHQFELEQSSTNSKPAQVEAATQGEQKANPVTAPLRLSTQEQQYIAEMCADLFRLIRFVDISKQDIGSKVHGLKVVPAEILLDVMLRGTDGGAASDEHPYLRPRSQVGEEKTAEHKVASEPPVRITCEKAKLVQPRPGQAPLVLQAVPVTQQDAPDAAPSVAAAAGVEPVAGAAPVAAVVSAPVPSVSKVAAIPADDVPLYMSSEQRQMPSQQLAQQHQLGQRQTRFQAPRQRGRQQQLVPDSAIVAISAPSQQNGQADAELPPVLQHAMQQAQAMRQQQQQQLQQQEQQQQAGQQEQQPAQQPAPAHEQGAQSSPAELATQVAVVDKAAPAANGAAPSAGAPKKKRKNNKKKGPKASQQAQQQPAYGAAIAAAAASAANGAPASAAAPPANGGRPQRKDNKPRAQAPIGSNANGHTASHASRLNPSAAAASVNSQPAAVASAALKLNPSQPPARMCLGSWADQSDAPSPKAVANAGSHAATAQPEVIAQVLRSSFTVPAGNGNAARGVPPPPKRGGADRSVQQMRRRQIGGHDQQDV